MRRALQRCSPFLSTAVVIIGLVLPCYPALSDFIQQGSKLVGTTIPPGLQCEQGVGVSLSADGNTALVSGYNCGAWVFTRSNGTWMQQGGSLSANDGVMGYSVGLSADGNTAIIGGPFDNSDIGAAWVFTRNNGMWTQQGPKLVGTGWSGPSPQQGFAVALSADGNTAIVGGNADGCNPCTGAAWVFTRSNGMWTQQGGKLVGTGSSVAQQGVSVALSADGNTAIVGGWTDQDPTTGIVTGAAWIFTRSTGVWAQQGSKLIAPGGSTDITQGRSVSLSADGNTAIVGGPGFGASLGGAWVFTRSNGVWTQQGGKLVGTGAVGNAGQGQSVAISGDGNVAIVGGGGDASQFGATWVFTRSNGVWSQRGSKLVGTGAVYYSSYQLYQGWSVALSADARTGIVGGYRDNGAIGAAWVFVQNQAMVPTATHDFNADGKSDIAWRDTSGNTSIWLMNGTTVINQNTSFVGNIPIQWAIVGQRDFDGDSKADLLWRDTSGNVAIWEMNGTSVLNANSSFVSNVPTNWSIVGTGDFDADGKADILWHDTSGNVAIWEMDGTAILNANNSFVATVPNQWSIKGTGDFNGDGKADILWQDTSGNVAIWEMNGIAVLNAISSTVGNVLAQWSIKGTGDFNGDGKSDILWQDTSGNVAIWEMDGTAILNANSSFVANVPTQWSIQLTGDFNGDGKSDIVWQDTSHNVVIWEMNGTTIANANSAFVANVPGQWSIQHLAAE
jgi:hypothetical protein